MKKLSLLSIILLFSATICYGQPRYPAGRVVVNAYRQATKENKNIFMIFHASWCTWCHKLDDAMNDKKCKAFFDSNYVVIHLTVNETDATKNTPGADIYLKRYHGDSAGLPFWVITSSRGAWLGDSYMRTEGQTKDSIGINMGCPAEDKEVEAFCTILKSTSRMTEEQLAVIAKRFRKNKVSERTRNKKS